MIWFLIIKTLLSIVWLQQYMLRNFHIPILALLVLVSSSIILDHNSLANQFHEASQTYDVIVVGAGIAGTSAASKLAKAGKKVLLLQANDYIGGRTKTQNVPLLGGSSFNFELGANWIHGSNPTHPITMLAKEMGNVQLIETGDDSIIVYDEEGQDITEAASQKFDTYEQIFSSFQELQDQNLSVYNALQSLHPQTLLDRQFMFDVSYDIQFKGAAPIQKLNAKYATGDEKFDGNEMLVVSGYQRMAQYLSKNNGITVLLKHKVIQVNYANQISTVICKNGFKAKASSVVIAVPIGVLKKKAIKFTPSLPAQKSEAIEKIGFGNVVKILIVPKKAITIPQQQQYIGLATNNISERGSATYYVNIQAVANLTSLMTFGLGPNADRLESLPQDDLKQLISSRLSIILNSTIESSDFDIVRSTWRTSPNFGGAYTYAGIETRPIHWQNMAKPVFANKWHFCGEHTISIYRGTVHGAYLSGVKSADQILEETTEDQWAYNEQ